MKRMLWGVMLALLAAGAADAALLSRAGGQSYSGDVLDMSRVTAGSPGTLGNPGYCSSAPMGVSCLLPDWGLKNTGRFSHLQPANPWSGPNVEPGPGPDPHHESWEDLLPGAWIFSFDGDWQSVVYKYVGRHAWLVREGNIGEIGVVSASGVR